MIQLKQEKPAYLTNDLSSLAREWQRFTDGAVNFDEMEEALRGYFTATAKTEVEDLDEEEGNEEKFAPLAKLIPSDRGTLYFLAKKMIWAPESGACCWVVDYTDIVLHAAHHNELCMHIELRVVLNLNGEEATFEGGEDDCFPFLMVDFSLPSGQVDEAFLALSECAALHRDFSDSDSEFDCETETEDGEEFVEVSEPEDHEQKKTKVEKNELEQFDDEARDLLR